MAYEFMSLAEAEFLSEVPENATILAEVDGSIKRISGEGLGGSGNSLVIVESSFTDFYNQSSQSTFAAGPTDTYTYTANMEFADALAAFRACKLTSAVLYLSRSDIPMCVNCEIGNIDTGLRISAFIDDSVLSIFWNANGFNSK